MGRKRRMKRPISGSTLVRVEERGQIVVKPIDQCLPPDKWFKRMKREVQPNAKDIESVIGSIWWNLPAKRKLEIMKREGKFRSFA